MPKISQTPLHWTCHLPGQIGVHYYKKEKIGRAKSALADYNAILKSLGPDDVCLDLGANVGKFTKSMGKTGAQVYAFEPDPESFGVLVKAVKEYPNVICKNMAIGVGKSNVTLYRAKEYEKNIRAKSLGSSVVRKDRWAMDKNNTIEVAQVDFFDFIKALPKAVSLVKMDIEGAEWPILEEIARRKTANDFKYLFVETHEWFSSLTLMPRLLKLEKAFKENQVPYVNINWI